MPTIEELVPAAAASDGDYLPLSQAGVMRRVTRSQLLSGLQPALAVRQGALLGRSSGGTGEPEAIAVGENLLMRNGVLAGAAPFSVTTLPAVGAVSAVDTVAVAQGGRDASVPRDDLLARGLQL